MSSSVGPEMKFFRWILSHLTIIILISAGLYVYWSQYDFLSEEIAEPTIKPLVESPEQQQENKESFNNIDEPVSVNNNLVEQKVIEQKLIEKKNSEPQIAVSTYSSRNFSKRMNEYKQRLSAEEQEKMDNAAKTFQQESESAVKYPTNNSIKPVVKNDTADIDGASPGQVTIKEKVASQSVEELQDENLELAYVKEKKAEVPAPLKAEPFSQSKADDEEPYRQATTALVVPMKTANVQDKKLQQQIRDRQKQLQDQMLLLIPLGTETETEKKTDTDTIANKKNINIKQIQPLIHTSEQRELLNDARQAFDLREFKAAEEKYLQLIKQLPELPDVVGELANVYKTQNKIPDYLVTNTQFVKRLVNHNRFNEALKVVMVTDKIDKKTANKQRRIINKKQKEL